MRMRAEERGSRGQGLDFMAASRQFYRPNIMTRAEETIGTAPSRQNIRTQDEETGGRVLIFTAPSRNCTNLDAFKWSEKLSPGWEFNKENIVTGDEETGGRGLGFMAPCRECNRQNIRTGDEKTGGRGFVVSAASRSSEMRTGSEKSSSGDQGCPFMASSRDFNTPEASTVRETSGGVNAFMTARLRCQAIENRRSTFWNSEMAAEKARSKLSTPLPCPYCQSLETKFRYFNNYDVKQPRHFCKNCNRWWTRGEVWHKRGRRKNASKLVQVQEPEGEIETAKESINETRISSFNNETARDSSLSGVAGIDLNVPYLEETDGANAGDFINTLTS